MSKQKPEKPSPDFPLFPHASGKWAKKIGGKLRYFGTWDDPIGALAEFSGKSSKGSTPLESKGGIEKPARPYPGFPLFPHDRGQWAKKVRGKTHYFGVWADPTAALNLWLEQKDALLAGKPVVAVPAAEGQYTIKQLVNHFLHFKKGRIATGELSERTYKDYEEVGITIIEVLGGSQALDALGPNDFERLRSAFSKGKTKKLVGPVRLTNLIRNARIIFLHAYEKEMIDRPLKFGKEFRGPSATVLRKHNADKEPRMWEPEQIHAAIDKAPIALKAMILLGVNCGFGNNDCAKLPLTTLSNLDAGWLTFPRPKTGVKRRIPLWPETVEAIREYLKVRPAPKNVEDSGLVFITSRGLSFAPRLAKKKDSPISQLCYKVLNAAGIYRKGLDFYGLRHTFQTIGDECNDDLTVRVIMGHADESEDMSARYREKGPSEVRKQKVVEHVRQWLYAKRIRESLPLAGRSAS